MDGGDLTNGNFERAHECRDLLTQWRNERGALRDRVQENLYCLSRNSPVPCSLSFFGQEHLVNFPNQAETMETSPVGFRPRRPADRCTLLSLKQATSLGGCRRAAIFDEESVTYRRGSVRNVLILRRGNSNPDGLLGDAK
jgi:hypothetical protein